MQGNVIVIFNDRQRLEWPVELVAEDRQLGAAARAWFEQTWEELECEPLRVSGKVFLMDKIMGIAQALGYPLLARDASRANEFARQVILALERPHVTIDLPGLAITY